MFLSPSSFSSNKSSSSKKRRFEEEEPLRNNRLVPLEGDIESIRKKRKSEAQKPGKAHIFASSVQNFVVEPVKKAFSDLSHWLSTAASAPSRKKRSKKRARLQIPMEGQEPTTPPRESVEEFSQSPIDAHGEPERLYPDLTPYKMENVSVSGFDQVQSPGLPFSPIANGGTGIEASSFARNEEENISRSMSSMSFLDHMQRQEEESIFQRWKSQYTTQKPWRSPEEPKVQARQELHRSHEDQLFSPPLQPNPFGSPPQSRVVVQHVDYEHQRAVNRAREKLLEERRYYQKRLSEIAVIPRTHRSASEEIDLTNDGSEYDRSFGPSFYKESKEYNRTKAELDSILKFDPSVEFKHRLAQEEEEKRNEEIEQKREKLRMLAEAYKRESEQLTAEAKKRMQKPRGQFPPLTEEEEATVSEALDGDDDLADDVVAQGFNLSIRKEDIWRLKDCEWLNDEVINFYMEVLLDRNNKSDNKYPKCHFFNSFFYQFLSKPDGYTRVRKWTRKVDIFQMDKVVIPVHMGNHWCLAVINFKEKRFEYYDSLGGTNGPCLKALRKYVKDEYKDKKKSEFDLSGWTDYTPADIPHQQNGYDCGVFACKYADFVSKNQEFSFDQKHMQYFRKRLVLDIVNKSYSY